MALLTETYSDQISGIFSCYDRIVIQGTLPGFCYAGGMTQHLYANNIRIFDYPQFAEPLRNQIRCNAEQLAKENAVDIQFLSNRKDRKEKLIKKIIETRGDHPGLVHIFSAMEACSSYKPWHDKQTHKTYLKPTRGKCLHYYFYFIDELLGLCHVRVPTWCPFRLQIYFNGHSRIANLLEHDGYNCTVIENALVQTDFDVAQQLSDKLEVKQIHHKLDQLAKLCCPVTEQFDRCYHWSVMQIEYATDIIFKSRDHLQAIYQDLVRNAVLSVKASDIATFLGRKLHQNYQDEMGNDLNTRICGTRIKHKMGPVSIKMYDKFGYILRIETTVNDVSFFKHYRKVEHRDNTSSMKNAPMKKGIYSLSALQELLAASNRRYLEFISCLDDHSVGRKNLNKISNAIIENSRRYKGFNLFDVDDQQLFEIIASGAFVISGFQNKNIREQMPDKSSGQISRILKRLRTHGLIKKIGRTYKYYLTKLGRKIITSGLMLKELYIIPKLATL